jgi:hypothetical protein
MERADYMQAVVEVRAKERSKPATQPLGLT